MKSLSIVKDDSKNGMMREALNGRKNEKVGRIKRSAELNGGMNEIAEK
jgi:hypothetical protein